MVERTHMNAGVKAWTGGSDPAPLATVHPHERGLITFLFHEQVCTYMTFWRISSVERDTIRLFWRRARYDAHATYR